MESFPVACSLIWKLGPWQSSQNVSIPWYPGVTLTVKAAGAAQNMHKTQHFKIQGSHVQTKLWFGRVMNHESQQMEKLHLDRSTWRAQVRSTRRHSDWCGVLYNKLRLGRWSSKNGNLDCASLAQVSTGVWQVWWVDSQVPLVEVCSDVFLYSCDYYMHMPYCWCQSAGFLIPWASKSLFS